MPVGPQHDTPTLEPEPASWPAAVRAHASDPNPLALPSRIDLGLPADRPVVLSGHQPGFWHPGILAKWFAAVHLARACDGASAWIVVDHDPVRPLELRVPRSVDGRWTTTLARLDPTHPPANQPTPALAQPPARTPAWRAPEGVPRAHAEGVARVVEALRAHAHEPSAARQAALAARDLLAPLADPPTLVFASDLARTHAMRALVDGMREDPAACARAYNNAVAQNPEARLRPLAILPGRVELPLWTIDPATRRRTPTFAEHLRHIHPTTILPRALLLTLVARLALGDFFIHGTGGGGEHGYDRCMEQWARAWLAPSPLAPLRLAPRGVCTATLRLDLGEDEGPDPSIDQWRAHHAPHTPAMLGDEGAQREKDALVARVAATRDPAERRALYQDLHARLRSFRARHAPRLAHLAHEAQRARDASRGLARSRSLQRDRTWGFPLYDASALLELSERVRRGVQA